MKILKLGFIAAILALIVWGSCSLINNDSGVKQSEQGNVYLIRLTDVPRFGKNSVGIDSIDALIRKHNSKVSDLFAAHNENTELGRWIVLSDDNEELLDILRHTEGIEVFEKRGEFSLIDPVFEDPGDDVKKWNLAIVKAAEAHKMLKGNKQTIIVAVVDTGIDRDHPALKDRLAAGRNIVDGNDDPRNKTKTEMHGTHVAGTIVMDPKNSQGAFGIAYPAAKVMPVRVLNERGMGTTQHIAQGIIWAADHGARVINLSLGGPQDSAVLHDAIKHAVNTKHVVVVAAKGNSSSDRPLYPASYPEVMSVTATDKNDGRAPFSSYGKDSCCAAPGHQIYSSVPGNEFKVASGTSMASPHVAAAAALILAKNPKLTPKEVREIVKTQGDEIKSDQPIGRRINIVNFLKKAGN